MNDQDKEAFEKWKSEYISTHTGYFKMVGTDDLAQVVWQSACDYKQKEIDELKTQDQIIAKEIKTYMVIAENLRTVVRINQTENAKLRDALDKIDRSNDDMTYFNSDIHVIIHEVREELNELENK